MEAAEERERERYKAAAKKKEKSGTSCATYTFAFGSLTYVKAREAKLLAKAMNVGALFAFIWFPGKKQPTRQRT